MGVLLDPNQASDWSQWVTNFDAAYAAFQQSFANLAAQQNYVNNAHPELLDEYNQLMQGGENAAQQLTNLKTQRDVVASWLTSIGAAIQSGAQGTVNLMTIGEDTIADAATSLWQSLTNAVGGVWGAATGTNLLGVAPVVVAVGLVAAGGVILLTVKWITDSQNMSTRLQALQQQEARGLTTQQAIDSVNQVLGEPSGPSILGVPQKDLVWIAAGLTGLFILPRVLK